MFDEMNQVSDDQGLVFRESGNYDEGINDASSKITQHINFHLFRTTFGAS